MPYINECRCEVYWNEHLLKIDVFRKQIFGTVHRYKCWDPTENARTWFFFKQMKQSRHRLTKQWKFWTWNDWSGRRFPNVSIHLKPDTADQIVFSAADRGPMLWSQFSAIFGNFRLNNWRFCQKTMLWSNFCITMLSFFSAADRGTMLWS
jgi:hypothetical protein